jgi:acyl carrier protein
MNHTFNALKEILTQRFDVPSEQIQPETVITELGLDSLTLMEFIFAAEDHFGLRIPEEKFDPRQAGLTLCQVAAAIEVEKACKSIGSQ